MYCNVNFVCIETIVLASYNLNKAEEIQMLLGSQFNVITQQAFDIPPIEETGTTFHENAFLKAKNHKQWYLVFGLATAGGILTKSILGVFPLAIVYF